MGVVEGVVVRVVVKVVVMLMVVGRFVQGDDCEGELVHWVGVKVSVTVEVLVPEHCGVVDGLEGVVESEQPEGKIVVVGEQVVGFDEEEEEDDDPEGEIVHSDIVTGVQELWVGQAVGNSVVVHELVVSVIVVGTVKVEIDRSPEIVSVVGMRDVTTEVDSASVTVSVVVEIKLLHDDAVQSRVTTSVSVAGVQLDGVQPVVKMMVSELAGRVTVRSFVTVVGRQVRSVAHGDVKVKTEVETTAVYN